MNILKELLTMLLDSVKHGDLTGHLRAWRLVATGRITLDTTAAGCLDAKATLKQPSKRTRKIIKGA